jgi:hypothetical protein
MNKVTPEYMIITGKVHGRPFRIRYYYATKRYHVSLTELRGIFDNIDQIDFDIMISSLKSLPYLKDMIFDEMQHSPIMDDILALSIN